jgi:hypothetical protein
MGAAAIEVTNHNQAEMITMAAVAATGATGEVETHSLPKTN